ncbi:TetR/AcrR family transcriptional regulator [Nonomuraea sp. NPDC050790]|uniref:TetR/AcrR family transcriptional regulator n=1 Tax=Nonomuraea sp. NPDC050790 TaxID=3364371 RepID=UPI00379E0C31
MSPAGTPYHHGDLRAACLRAARELLEEDGSAGLSLRAVARRAGVSPTAPYRHFADRDALISAVAAQGYRELTEHLAAAHPAPRTPDDLADIAIAYVRFALERPAMFKIMFAEPCDPTSQERAAAITAISGYLHDIVRRTFPARQPEPLANALWALVHGLAFLHLDGKFDISTPQQAADHVRSAIHALFPSTSTTA